MSQKKNPQISRDYSTKENKQSQASRINKKLTKFRERGTYKSELDAMAE